MINSWMGIGGPVNTWDSVVNQRQGGVCLCLDPAEMVPRQGQTNLFFESSFGVENLQATCLVDDYHGQVRGDFTCNLKDH